MDGATLLRKVQRRFGDDSQIVFTTADIIDWINDGQMQIARETGCLTGSTSGQASTYPISYPADFLRCRRVVYGTRSLDEVTIEDLDQKKLDLSVQDVPYYYYYVNNTIALYPDPASTDTTTVTVQYAKTPTVITVIGDALTIPVHYHEDLVNFCLMRAHERNENWKGMEIAKAQLDETKATRKEDFDNPEDTYPTVRDDPYEMWWY